ncbi:MAG: hypothetical protein P8Y37_05070, partial [Anaerolineales bacterium]
AAAPAATGNAPTAPRLLAAEEASRLVRRMGELGEVSPPGSALLFVNLPVFFSSYTGHPDGCPNPYPWTPVGAVVIPLLSDHFRKRVPFLMASVIGATLGLVGVTFAAEYWLLLFSAFVFGFFLLSAGPVGFQYAAEITYPTPEGTSNGLALLMGQISGIAFILGMDLFKSAETGSMTVPLLVLIGLLVLSLFLAARLQEAKTLLTDLDSP